MNPSSEAGILTDIMLSVFRTNGKLIADGDRLAATLGLTSARWQVLGAISLAGSAQTVPQIAETMGMTRQGAQKQIDILQGDGLVIAKANPRHKRSPFFALTDAGSAAYAELDRRYRYWAEELARSIDIDLLSQARQCLSQIEQCLSRTDPIACQPSEGDSQ